MLSKGVQEHALNGTVVQLFRLFCDKQESLPWLRQCQEFSRHFPVQEEAMGLGQKKCLTGSLREFTDGRMEHSAGSVNGQRPLQQSVNPRASHAGLELSSM